MYVCMYKYFFIYAIAMCHLFVIVLHFSMRRTTRPNDLIHRPNMLIAITSYARCQILTSLIVCLLVWKVAPPVNQAVDTTNKTTHTHRTPEYGQ